MAVSSCLDADLEDGGGRGGGSAPASATVSPSAAAAALRVSFRGLFEAFASTLEHTSSYRNGGDGGGGGGVGGGTESVGREGVALLLYSLLQVSSLGTRLRVEWVGVVHFLFSCGIALKLFFCSRFAGFSVPLLLRLLYVLSLVAAAVVVVDVDVDVDIDVNVDIDDDDFDAAVVTVLALLCCYQQHAFLEPGKPWLSTGGGGEVRRGRSFATSPPHPARLRVVVA